MDFSASKFSAQVRQMSSLAYLSAVLIFSGCSDSGINEGGSVGDSIRIQLDYYPEASHGGFYQAKLNGFYEQAGIEQTVEILSGGNGVYPLQQVALGKADFGIGRLDDLILAIERGLPLRAVVATYQRDPQALMFHAGQDIESFEDLDGRTVMAIPGAGFIEWIEREYEISLNLIPLNYDITQFVVNKELVQQCYITSQPFYLQEKGVEVETLLIADTGFGPIRILYVNSNFSKKNPELVRQVGAATVRGIADYLEGDRSQADELLFELNEVNNPALNDFTVAKINEYQLAIGNEAAGEALGLILPERVDRIVQALLDIKMLDADLSYADIVDPVMID